MTAQEAQRWARRNGIRIKAWAGPRFTSDGRVVVAATLEDAILQLMGERP